jgi:hypothetical protein
MVALVLLVGGSLCAPTAAQAQNPLDLLPSLPDLNPASWAVDGFKAILEFVFGDDLRQLAEHLVNLLLAIRCSATPRSSRSSTSTAATSVPPRGGFSASAWWSPHCATG